ncbi:FAD-dependent oxidoreductase [Natronomonas salina]|uniref:FAD-dependent oxidoreductase n=1 Tax=Natronomonas salina TaxID=1710540 RepID=UPI0015B74D11|nr:FAD-dependent oxidoreductase [Natronomonas salina]QLD87726.1 FAD-dependent oxidoreductase [Natronomonas salina]
MDGTEVEIVGVSDVGPDTVALAVEAPRDFDARPGQFVQVRATVDGEAVTRHYTVSSPRVTETFEITVGVDPGGTLSPWLADASPGDAVEVDGPFGRVYYEGESRAVVLAAGPGIGPAVAVAERAIQERNDAAVVYRSEALVHEARLSGLALAGVDVFVVGEDRFADAVAAAVGDGQTFVYGFEPFVEAAERAVGGAGGDWTAAKVENFG